MRKHEIFKFYLEDPFFKDNEEFNFLKDATFDWNSDTANNLIIILKKVIEETSMKRKPTASVMNYINNLEWKEQ